MGLLQKMKVWTKRLSSVLYELTGLEKVYIWIKSVSSVGVRRDPGEQGSISCLLCTNEH